MDLKNGQAQDVSNFSSPSPHRMPTVSAAQALSDLKSSSKRLISTGIPQLDAKLQNNHASVLAGEQNHGGVSRGQVTEIYGPPGAGKTAIGMQLAANVLVDGGKVTWIDAAHLLPIPRFLNILSSRLTSRKDKSSIGQQQASTSSLLRKLTHITTPSLPHLLALLSQKEPPFPPTGTSLIIIDSLSTLINNAFPKINNSTSTPRKPAAGAQSQGGKQNAAQWAASRKWTVLQNLISLLSKISALNHVAVIILQQTATRMRDGSGAALVPSISSAAWDAGIASRIVLFQDWGPENAHESSRYAGVLKAEGIVGPNNRGLGRVVPFAIRETGIVPSVSPTSTPQAEQSALPKIPVTSTRKRKLEIEDSEEEEGLDDSDNDYGWDAEDEADIPDPPPRTQGSEDILLPGVIEEEDEEDVEREADVMALIDDYTDEQMYADDDYGAI